MSALNKYVALTKFKMESTKSVLASVQKGDWLTSLDLRDAYLHVPMHPDSRRFLRFMFNGNCYEFKVLPFGLSSAPQVFTRVMAQAGRWLHLQSVRILLYLDDWLVLSYSEAHARQCTAMTLRLCLDLGIVVNLPKSDLLPSRKATYLGMDIDTDRYWVAPRSERVLKFLPALQAFLASDRHPAQQWQQVLGYMSSLEPLTPGGRLRTRRAQIALSSQWRYPSDPATMVCMPQPVRQDLLWWQVPGRVSRGRSLVAPVPDMYLYTDASLRGWGAVLEAREAKGVWRHDETALHINVLEMKAVHRALLTFSGLVRHKVLAVLMDNTTALSYLRKQGGTTSPTLLEEARLVLELAELLSVTLLPAFVPGDLNVLADRLSRRDQTLKKEWTLHCEVCLQLWALWGTPFVDLFATKDNARLNRFVSPVRDSRAWAVDAMLISWDGVLSYAYPPSRL